MDDNISFQDNAAFREALQRLLNRIEVLESYLQRELSASSPELLGYYIQLGEAYTALFNLIVSFNRNFLREDNATQLLDPYSTFTISEPVPGQNTLQRQSTLAIANAYYERASNLVNTETYPKDRQELDKARIEGAARTTKDEEKAAHISINKAGEKTRQVINANRKPYDGILVQPIAFRLPLVLLIFLVLLSGISLYWRIPISTALHIPPYDCESGSITVNGSTILMPLIKIAASEYHKLCPGPNTIITVNPPGLANEDTNSLSQLLAQKSPLNIAVSDTFATTALSQLQDYPVAVAVYVLVVNKDVYHLQQPHLSSDQIGAIYSGSITTWSAIHPADPNWNSEAITLVSRPSTSPARAIFERDVLGGPETVSGPPHLMSDTDEAIAASICNNSGAVGYIPLFYYYDYNHHHSNCLQIVSIDNHDPRSAELIKNDTYKFWSLEHMYTKGLAGGLTQAFINFMYSDIMKSYFNQYNAYGYLSVSDISANLLSTH